MKCEIFEKPDNDPDPIFVVELTKEDVTRILSAECYANTRLKFCIEEAIKAKEEDDMSWELHDHAR